MLNENGELLLKDKDIGYTFNEYACDIYTYIVYICKLLCHWPTIVGMSPQSHCGNEEDGRIGLSS